ncbi:unnamed protein product [Closterium sp. NIES-54]
MATRAIRGHVGKSESPNKALEQFSPFALPLPSECFCPRPTLSAPCPTVTAATVIAATAATAAPAILRAAQLWVLTFDHEGRPILFDTWLDDLQLYLQSDSKDTISLFDLVSGAATAPPATADSSTRSLWLTRDAAARLAIHNHLPLTEPAHFRQHWTAQALYNALSAFAIVGDLVSHLCASDARYCATAPAEFLDKNQPPMFITLYFIVTRLPDSLRSVRDLFLSLDPTSLIVDLLKQHLLAAETSAVVVGAARGTPRPPFFEGCSPSPLAPSYASAAAVEPSVAEDVGAASASAKRRSSRSKGGRGGGGGTGGGGGGSGSDGGGSGGGTGGSGGGRGGGTVGGSGGSGGNGGGSGRSGGSGGGGTGSSGTGARRVGLGGGQPSQVVASAQVSGSSQVAASCSCRLLSHQTLLWHHRLGHPFLPHLRGMHSRLLVSGLPRSLPPLPSLPALPCLPCIEGRQRAAPHSSSFPPTTAPLQTLHMDVWGPARVSGQGRERFFLLVVNDYTRYTTVFPLRNKGQVVDVLIPLIRTVRLQLRERFAQDLPILRLHSNRGGKFSSTLLRDFCRGDGILQSFTLPASPQQNGISKRCIGLVMEVARTSMIHAAAPHFLWPFAVRYAAHQLNLLPHVSLPETSPTLPTLGLGILGLCFAIRQWTSSPPVLSPASSLALSPTRLAGSLTTPPRAVSSLPRTSRLMSPAPSGVSQVDPLPGSVPLQGAQTGGVEPGGVEPGGAEPGGVATGGGEPGGAEPEGVEPGGAALEGVGSGGEEPRGAALSGGSVGASPRVSPQQLREWFVRHTRLRSGASGAGGAGAAGAGGLGVAAGVGVTRGPATSGPEGAHTRGIVAAGTGGVEGVGAGAPTEPGATGAGGTGTGGAGARGAGAAGVGAVDPGAGGPGDTVQPRPYFVPLLQQVLGVPSSTGLAPPLLCPPPDQSQLPLQPASQLPAPSLYTKQSGGLTECPRTLWHFVLPLPSPPESSLPEVPDPESNRACAASPLVARILATACTNPSIVSAVASALVAELLYFAAACRLDYASAFVAESASASPPSVVAAVPRFASMQLAAEGDTDAPDIPTPRSYVEAITGPYSSLWQAAMDAEMASWKSTGTYVDEVPPPGENIVDGMWIFRVKRPPGSPPAFKARYVARGFSQRQGVDFFQTFSPTPKMTTLRVLLHVAAQCDYEMHSLDFNTAFLQGSLHEEIWLRRPPGFTESFPAGTQWSFRRPVYRLRQAPREWHDTLRTTLAALGFAPATADPSLFLRTDTPLPPFYVLV